MNKTDTAAFPEANDILRRGLTKREYFAAAALQGILSTTRIEEDNWDTDEIATWSVALADSLILELAGESRSIKTSFPCEPTEG